MIYNSEKARLLPAFCRAYHAKNAENPVFCDNVAEKLLTEDEYREISRYITENEVFAPEIKKYFDSKAAALEFILNAYLAPTFLAYSSFCENAVKNAALFANIQYVILGAGLDTFTLRNENFVKSRRVFEVDTRKAQEDKEKRLSAAHFSLPENLIFVPADFSEGGLYKNLKNAGFDPSKKAVFSLSDICLFLSENETERLFETLSSFAADGSSAVFAFANGDIFSSKSSRVKNLLSFSEAAKMPIKSGFLPETLARILEKHGFLIYELLCPYDIKERYFKGRKDGLSAFENICIAEAVLKK